MTHTSFDVQFIKKALQNMCRSLKCLKYWKNSGLQSLHLSLTFNKKMTDTETNYKLEIKKTIQTPHN